MITGTSLAALESISETGLEETVYETILHYGYDGCISDEVRSHHPTLSYSSITARFAALERKHLIVRSGDKRKGISGREQLVMRATVLVGLPLSAPLIPPKKRNGFQKGLMHAAKLILESANLRDAKLKIRNELLRSFK